MQAISPARLQDDRCPEAKARATANARTYGLSHKDVIIANAEEQLEFDQFITLQLVEIHPNGSVEHTVFDEMIAAGWNLRRIRRLETALNQSLDPLAALDDDKLQAKLDRLARHQSRIERSYYRAQKQLSVLQTERILQRTHPHSQSLDDASPLLNSAERRRASDVRGRALASSSRPTFPIRR
jgi:hypothetical protein